MIVIFRHDFSRFDDVVQRTSEEIIFLDKKEKEGFKLISVVPEEFFGDLLGWTKYFEYGMKTQ